MYKEGPTAPGSIDSLPGSKVSRKPALKLCFLSPIPPHCTAPACFPTPPRKFLGFLSHLLAGPVCGKDSFILMLVGKKTKTKNKTKPSAHWQRLGGLPHPYSSPSLHHRLGQCCQLSFRKWPGSGAPPRGSPPTVWSFEKFPASSTLSWLTSPRLSTLQHQALICLLSTRSVPWASRDLLPSGAAEPWTPFQGRLLRVAPVWSHVPCVL